MSLHASAQPRDQRSVLGSGLPLPLYAAVVVFSVTLFLVWGGLLWETPRNASHVGRFFVSYAAVVPVVALLLLALRRFTWLHLTTATGTSWAIKLVVTSTLYFWLARGTAADFQAASHVPPASALASAPYEGLAGAFAGGAVFGQLQLAAGERGVVLVERPAAGRALPAPRELSVRLEGGRYAEPLYLVGTDDLVTLESTDPVLHTAHVYLAGRSVGNTPLPAGAAQPLRLDEAGVYEVRCDTHPGERTFLVVVEHPYAVLVGAEGQFRLDQIPAGSIGLEAVRATADGMRRVRAPVELHPQEELSVHFPD